MYVAATKEKQDLFTISTESAKMFAINAIATQKAITINRPRGLKREGVRNYETLKPKTEKDA